MSQSVTAPSRESLLSALQQQLKWAASEGFHFPHLGDPKELSVLELVEVLDTLDNLDPHPWL